MFAFSEIPEVPQDEGIIYSHPYQIPKYNLNDFEIDFEYFSIENKDKLIMEENQELEEKIYKIRELNKLKKIEHENKRDYEKEILECQKALQNNQEGKRDIENINKLINNIENITVDLTRYFLNYHSSKQNILFDKLNNLIYNSNLLLTGEAENTRSKIISHELAILKPDSPKRPKPK